MRSEQGTAVQATAVGQLGHRLVGNASQVFTRSRRTSPLPVADAPTVVIVRDLDELKEHRLALENLAAEALESNIFYEPILLEPAVRHFGVGRQLELVLVYRSDGGARSRPRLTGFFPFERVGRYGGLPVSALVSFKHLHCFLCTPLVRRQGANETFSTALDWLTKTSGATLIELGSIGAAGSVHQLLLQELHQRRRLFWLRNWSTRAFFEPAVDAERYLHGAVSGLALKEVRRKARRLGEQGRLAWRELEPGEDARPWLDDFLRLEASGWKGREGSALACSAGEGDFFVAAATAAHARGRLMFLGLFLDDRPLALKCNFLTADGGYAFKIAFAEAYRAFSPGFLLEVENVRRLHRRPGVRWMDSCADAQHAMINRLWPGRRSLATVVFGAGRAPGDLLVSLLPLLRWGRRRLARRARAGGRALHQDGD
jgi:CelD/BcsL family acetyltransferase involved in cellulose biosynthesis